MLRHSVFVHLVMTVLLVGCGDKPAPIDTSVPIVAVSIAPFATLVDELAGDDVRTVVMLPNGASPATHEPTLADMQALSQASIYVQVGHPGFEFEMAWLGRILERNTRMQIVDVSRSAAGPGVDAHVWTSPSVMRGAAADIAAALQTMLPEQHDAIATRLLAWQETLDSLRADIARELQPYAGRTFYVFHPAWGWFASEFGLTQVAVEQHGAHGAEPSSEHLARIIDRARADRVLAVYVQPQFSRRSARLLADAIDARVVVLDPLAPDWLPNMRRVTQALQEGWLRP